MKYVKLLHNPKAGGREYTRDQLVSIIHAAGFNCRYSSTKSKGWEKLDPGRMDFLVVAGGDGTIRKVAGRLLQRRLLDKKIPISVFPLGTANNIAVTLGITHKPEDVAGTWSEACVKKLDAGRIYGIRKSKFFLEAFGYGVFPLLMKEMKKRNNNISDPQERQLTAWQALRDIITSFKPHFCKLLIDGIEHEGEFLSVEIMNMCSVGPNLNLAPLATPQDGKLDVVLITEQQREEFAIYIENKIRGREEPFVFESIKARHIEVYWDGTVMHSDEEIIRLKQPARIKVELLEGVLDFYTA